MIRTLHPAASLVGAAATALALSACKIDNRPLLARGEPPPYAAGAPPLGPLDPATAPLALAPAEAYAYPERAYAVSRVVQQRPPSYGFAYRDEQPWAWDAGDEGLVFAEPYDDDWRYYYYEPGEAYPYFVQDADYGYAYGDGGVLLALFDAAGALIARDRYDDYAPRAGAYWTRAYDLNRSYWASPRHRVQETAWLERRPALVATQERWFRAAAAQPAWRERHDNGLHRGWDKQRGEKDRGREIAFAPSAARPEPRADAKPWHEARREVGPQPARGQPRGHGDDKGRADRSGHQKFARAAEDHGRAAAAHSGGHGKPDHDGGGGTGGGQGNGHGGGKGGGHADKGGGHGGGGQGGGKGHGR